MRLVSLLLLVGCSGSAGGGDGGAPDLAVPVDGGGTSDLAGGSANDLAYDPNGKHASISLFSGSYMLSGQPKIATTASAQFTIISGEQITPCTSVATYGACIATTGCAVGGIPTVVYDGAGVVTITGGKQTVTLTPGTGSMYPVFSDQTSTLWNGGETLTVSVAGDTVPAFTGSLIAPSPFALTAPLPVNKTFTITLGQDLTFTWTGAGSATVEITLDGPNKTPPLIVCNFPGAAGSGTIPKAALANFSPGSGATFAGAVVTSVPIQAGDWPIGFTAAVPFVINGEYLNIADVIYQ
jgi:hypothetical protein